MPTGRWYEHDQVVIFGVFLAALGLALAVFPRPFVAAATRYRIWMPDRATPQTLRSARVGAVAVIALGVVVIVLA